MLKRIMATTAIALALSAPAWAQQQAQPQDQQTQEQQAQQQAEKGQAKDLSMVSADDVKDADILNQQGEKIGDVQHVVLDQQTGRVKYAVVGVGGFLGIGEKNVAVPWEQMQASTKENSYTLNVDRQTLEKAPPVDMQNLQALDQPQTQQQITQFWQDAESQQAQTPSQQQPQGQPQER